MRCRIIPMLFLVCSCYDELETLDEQTPEEREEELRLRTQELAERWIAHEEKQKDKEAEANEAIDTEPEGEQKPKTNMEKAIALKAGVLKKAQGVREKSEKTKLVIDSLELALDMEAEGLRQDFAKAKLEVTEVGNHLECVLVSADDEFTHLPQQAYEIEWWYQGKSSWARGT